MSEMDDVDPNMVKLFKMAQLIIEFLLHSQSFLLKERVEEQKYLKLTTETNGTLKKQVEQLTTNVEESRKELKSLKKTLFVYELMSKVPGGANGKQSTASYHVAVV